MGVNVDPERTLKFQLNGSFNVSEDKADAPTGETDIMVESFGTLKVTNVSDGRAVDISYFGDWDTGLELFVPIEACPDWVGNADGEVGTHCSRDIVELDIPNLDVDEDYETDLDNTTRVASVSTEDAQMVMDQMLSDSSVVIHADRVFINEYIAKGNPTCEAGDIEWVTYFTENPAVTACSTEPGVKKE